VFVDGAQIYSRPDEKSQYALTALKQTLEKQELPRQIIISILLSSMSFLAN